MWEVEVTDEFLDWWTTLTIEQQEAVTDRVDVLSEQGPDLGRPIVDRIHSSRHQSIKELRAAKGGALRVLFSFDPRRQAILLLGGLTTSLAVRRRRVWVRRGDDGVLELAGRSLSRRPLAPDELAALATAVGLAGGADGRREEER